MDSLLEAIPAMCAGEAIGITSVTEENLPPELDSVPLEDGSTHQIGIVWQNPALDTGMVRLVPALRRVFARSPKLASSEAGA